MLCCKTRGNTAPAGKTKIYIIARPEDHSQYLDVVVKILLYTMNVAIYYDDGEEEIYRLDEQHKEYQLTVAMVTKGFLLTKNPARERELAFAMNRNLPIFPFTFEPGVDILFDKIVGHYQCLYAGQQTGTEKDFYQKLRDAVSSVIKPEELNREICEKAFDLFLFISYRKVDRKYVNEYVNRIHQIPALQGIGQYERSKEYLTMQLQLTTQYLEFKGEVDIKAARSYVASRILLNDAELALKNYSTAEVYGERQLLQPACKYKTEAAEMGNAIYKEWMSTHNLMNLIQDLSMRQDDLANLSDYDVLTVYAPNMDRVYGRLHFTC